MGHIGAEKCSRQRLQRIGEDHKKGGADNLCGSLEAGINAPFGHEQNENRYQYQASADAHQGAEDADTQSQQ